MSCITQHMHSVLTEEDRGQKGNHPSEEEDEEEENKDEKQITGWVLCSDDWRDIVIMYVPQLNTIPIEDNYAEISQEEIKKLYNNTREEHR